MISLNCEKRFFVLYALLLKPHANVRYRQSLQKLALLELECVLNAWGLDRAAPRLRLIAGEPFLVFEAGEMPEQVWRAVSGHSSICFAARLEGDALLPLERAAGSVMPDDLLTLYVAMAVTSSVPLYTCRTVLQSAKSPPLPDESVAIVCDSLERVMISGFAFFTISLFNS